MCLGGGLVICSKTILRKESALLPSAKYLPLNKTGAHSTGERFRATMALLFKITI